MPKCSGTCNKVFPGLSEDDLCGLCVKATELAGPELVSWIQKPQCNGCGILSGRIGGDLSLCGDCLLHKHVIAAVQALLDLKAADDGDSHGEGRKSPVTLDNIMQNATRHTSNATEFRITKRPMNHGLSKAHEFKKLKATAHRSAAKITVTKSSAPHPPDIHRIAIIIHWRIYYEGHQKVSKLPIASTTFEFDANLRIDTVIPDLLRRAEEVFVNSPGAPELDEGKVPNFGVRYIEVMTLESKGRQSIGINLRALSTSTKTIHDWRGTLIAGDNLSRTDQQRNSVSLKLALFEKHAKSLEHEGDTDEEVEATSNGKRRKTAQRSLTISAKRQRKGDKRDDSPSSSDGDNFTMSSFSGIQTRSTVQKNKQDVESVTELEDVAVQSDTDQATEVVPQRKDLPLQTPTLTPIALTIPFVSKFHCRTDSATPSSFVGHTFRRTDYILTPNGDVFLDPQREERTILVHRNWAEYRQLGFDCTVDGYLGKGREKCAFVGYTSDQSYALFQSGGVWFTNQLDSETENRERLERDLRSLALAHYFLEEFKQLAAGRGVVIPQIRYNAQGAFIGDLVHSIHVVPTSSMLYDSFLAVPFLNIPPGGEKRFTDVHGLGDDKTDMERILSAFTHAAYAHSRRSVLIADIQGVYVESDLVLYDPQVYFSYSDPNRIMHCDSRVMDRFRENHKCNSYCRSLGLPPYRSHPLRLGFSPMKA